MTTLFYFFFVHNVFLSFVIPDMDPGSGVVHKGKTTPINGAGLRVHARNDDFKLFPTSKLYQKKKQVKPYFPANQQPRKISHIFLNFPRQSPIIK